jgi:hypothetical protein
LRKSAAEGIFGPQNSQWIDNRADKEDGEPLTEEEYELLEEKTRKKIDEIGKDLQEKLNDVVRMVRESEKMVRGNGS